MIIITTTPTTYYWPRFLSQQQNDLRMSKRGRIILIAIGEYLGCVVKRITIDIFHAHMASFANVNVPKEANAVNSSEQSSDGRGEPRTVSKSSP